MFIMFLQDFAVDAYTDNYSISENSVEKKRSNMFLFLIVAAEICIFSFQIVLLSKTALLYMG